MWELDHKEGWAPKSWRFWTAVLEKTPESPLDTKEIKPVNPKGNQPWIFIGRTDTEAEAQVLWPPDAKSWFIKLWRTGKLGMLQSMGFQTVGHDLATEHKHILFIDILINWDFCGLFYYCNRNYSFLSCEYCMEDNKFENCVWIDVSNTSWTDFLVMWSLLNAKFKSIFSFFW